MMADHSPADTTEMDQKYSGIFTGTANDFRDAGIAIVDHALTRLAKDAPFIIAAALEQVDVWVDNQLAKLDGWSLGPVRLSAKPVLKSYRADGKFDESDAPSLRPPVGKTRY